MLPAIVYISCLEFSQSFVLFFFRLFYICIYKIPLHGACLSLNCLANHTYICFSSRFVLSTELVLPTYTPQRLWCTTLPGIQSIYVLKNDIARMYPCLTPICTRKKLVTLPPSPANFSQISQSLRTGQIVVQ